MGVRRVCSVVVAGAVLSAGLIGQASAASAAPETGVEVPQTVRSEVAARPSQVLVTYDASQARSGLATLSGGTTAQRTAALNRASEMIGRVKAGALSRTAGVSVTRDYSHLPVQLVTVQNPTALQELASAPGVVSLDLPKAHRLDPLRSTAALSTAAVATASWKTLINQPTAVSRGYDGRGIRVAVLDSGISTASGAFGDCSAGFGQRTCLVDRFVDASGSGVQEVSEHGTNVAGLVLETAPKAHLDVYGVFRQEGPYVTAYDSDILQAINQVLASAVSRDVRAVNLSLGSSDGTWYTSSCVSSYGQSFAQLRAAGVLPVVAAGNAAYPTRNSYHDGLSDPACASGAVSVGAVYPAATSPSSYDSQSICSDTAISADRVACFSQSAPILDLLAPGVDMTAAGLTETGTSQATPVVSGAIAAIASAARTASADTLQTALENHGKSVTDTRVSGRTTTRVDVAAAGASLVAGPNQVSSIGSTLGSGQSMTEAQQLRSPNSQHALGVSVVGFAESLRLGGACEIATLATPSGERTNVLSMQSDGNLVLYSDGKATWSTRTQGNPGARVVLQNDRNLVVYNSSNKALWASGRTCATLTAFDTSSRSLQTQSLGQGQFLLSSNRRYNLTVQSDGNVVLYGPRGAAWNSRTHGRSNPVFSVQSDGNVVLYSGGTAYFKTGTAGSGVNVSLRLQDDGNLVLYRGSQVLWQTRTRGA